MRHDVRAVLFDLDDTLYALDGFVLSGFQAVARFLQHEYGVDPATSLEAMARAFADGSRGRELQRCLDAAGLPHTLVPALVDVIRGHRPVLALPLASRAVLTALRTGWRIGIVTNGQAAIQARKVDALGLAPLVDTVVYAHAIGDGAGKPSPAPFAEAAARLGVAPGRAVFVGDDPVADVFGAGRAGMRTIHLSRRRAAPAVGTPVADATVRSLNEVPDVAQRLVD